MIKKSINELTPAELRKIAELREQIDLILNGSVMVTEPSEALNFATQEVHIKRPYRRKHWTQTPRGREIMRKNMLRRHAQGTI